MRIVVLSSPVVGGVIEAAISPYSGKLTGENSLLRTLHSTLQQGDVLLLDRYFSGWFDIALLQQRGAKVVVRKHQLPTVSEGIDNEKVAAELCSGRVDCTGHRSKRSNGHADAVQIIEKFGLKKLSEAGSEEINAICKGMLQSRGNTFFEPCGSQHFASMS